MKTEKQYLIQLNKKEHDFWKLNKKQGTILHIKNLTGISRMTLTQAFLKGVATQKTIDIINDYLNTEIENEQKRLRRKKQLF
jgi:hypothetical protein